MTPEAAADLFRTNTLPLDEATILKLLEFERLLLEWNEKINLVSRKDTAEVFTRQIVGSIAFLFSCRFVGGTKLLDVGTGGGLPGIPLSIIHPDIAVTMVDSIQKKIKAVDDIVARLGLAKATSICGRVEQLDRQKVGKFDYIVARGVSSATEIVGWCGELLRTKGRYRMHSPGAGDAPEGAGSKMLIPPGSFILLKGGDLTDELAQLSEIAPPASVVVRPLSVAGAEEMFTDKKVLIITP
jgi:16S rRNA (guanine527-N7)-methyltransferase